MKIRINESHLLYVIEKKELRETVLPSNVKMILEIEEKYRKELGKKYKNYLDLEKDMNNEKKEKGLIGEVKFFEFYLDNGKVINSLDYEEVEIIKQNS